MEPDVITELAAAPPFLLSSAFPYFQQSYFLPRPLGSTAPKLPDEDLHSHKKLKKIQWVASSLWHLTTANDLQFRVGDIDIVQSTVALPKANYDSPEKMKLWVEEGRPRLATDRISGAPLEGQLFNFGRVHFHPDAGLYFLVNFDSENVRQCFEAALSLLGDSGIGADRSNGNGFFSWQRADNFPKLMITNSNTSVALSLISPAPGDFSDTWLDGASYNLTSRGGWIAHHGLRRRRLRMFTEGSQFRRPLVGHVVEVTPTNTSGEKLSPHPVYRDGRGFFIETGCVS